MTPTRIATLLAVLLLPFSTSRAEEPVAASPARRAQIVSSSPLGDSFVGSSRETYQVVAALRAVSRGVESAGERMAGLGMASSDLVEQKGRILIVPRSLPTGSRSAQLRDASAVYAADGAPSYPVAVNTRTGQLGVLSGNVIAKLEDPGSAADLAAALGLDLEYVAEEIRFAYFRVPQGRDVVAAARALQAIAGVEFAYPQVTERFQAPR